MPIQNIGLHSPSRQSVQAGSDNKAVEVSPQQGNRQPSTPPNTVDSVRLTESAKKLQGLERILENVPVVDAQRVENVRNAIDSGSLTIDSQQVAEKFMQFERQLGV